MARSIPNLACFLASGLLAASITCNPHPGPEPARQRRADDTRRPSLPDHANLPVDSTFTVEAPDLPRAECLYYRNIFGIIFDDTTSGAAIRGLLSRYAGTIIGGNPGDREYIIRIPDPGPTFAAVDSVAGRLYAEPGVALARKVSYRTPIYIDGYKARDTAWPVLSSALPRLDTSRVVRLAGDTFQVYRTDISLRFKDGVTDSAKRAFFLRHSITVVGVTRSGQFFVRMPDPGPSVKSLFDALGALRREPEVGIVSLIPRSPLPILDP